MASAGSQLVFMPGYHHWSGDIQRARLLVVPVGVCLPPGAVRLVASSGSASTARPTRGILPSHALPLSCGSSALARVSTASARRGFLRAHAVGCGSPFVPPSGAGAGPLYSDLRASNPLASASRRSRTVAYGVHDSAAGGGDEANISNDTGADASKSKAKDDGADAGKDNGGVYNDDVPDAGMENGGVFKGKEYPKAAGSKDDRPDAGKENGGAFKGKECPKTAGSKDDRPDAGKENGGISKGKEYPKAADSKDDRPDAGKENGGVSNDDVHDAPKENGGVSEAKEIPNDGGAGSEMGSSKVYKDDWADAWKDVEVQVDALKAMFGNVSKDVGGAGSVEESGKVLKDEGADAKKKGDVSKDGGGAGSAKESSNDDGADGAVEDGTLQGRVDPRMILAELDLFGLGYDPLDNVYHVSTITYETRVLRELHAAMRECNCLLQRAMSRRPPLSNRAKDLVTIGKSFRVVTMEVEKGFVQSVSVLTAVEGLKAMGMLFLGPYIGFLKPIPNRDFPFNPPAGSEDKLYWNMLLDYYHTVFDCVSTEIFGLFAMDGKDFEGLG